MALSRQEITKLIEPCNKLSDGPDYRINDYLSNLMRTALDFQMKSVTLNKALGYFEAKHGSMKTHRELKELLENYPNTEKGNMQLALLLWDNRHWTRASFLRALLVGFETRGISDQASLRRWVEAADFNKDIKGRFRSQHHSIGPAIFNWLRIRCGACTVKPDTHVINFVSKALARKVSPADAVRGLEEVARLTERKASLLDAAIWLKERGDENRAVDRLIRPAAS